MPADREIIETHQCVFTRVPVTRNVCDQLTSVVGKNHDGCCRSQCTSAWRICRKCVLLPVQERSSGPIDATTGLCEKHGGIISIVEDVPLERISLEGQVLLIPTDQISPMPDQPRKSFDLGKLQALADSIGHRGQVQPGLVIRTPDGPTPYQLRDGERRLRACVMAGVPFSTTIQASKDKGRNEALLTSAVANFNREHHPPWEEIDLVRRLLEPCPDTGVRFNNAQVAESLGKHQVWISQRKVVGERLTTHALDHIVEHPHIPFDIIKQVADLPPHEQVEALYEYVEGKISGQILRTRAGDNRRKSGISRNRKPSDAWDMAGDLITTICERTVRISSVYSPGSLNGELRNLALSQGGNVAGRLEDVAAELLKCARLIRDVK